MKTKHIIIGLIIIVIVLFLIQKKEHAGTTTSTLLSNEAIQNIGSVYADSTRTASFNNIRAAGNANVNNLIVDSGNFTGDVLFNGNTTFKSSVVGQSTNFPASDNKNYIRGETIIDGIANFNDGAYFKGGTNPNNWQTHFPYKVNGNNYIRGTTNIDGEVRFNNGIIYKGNSFAECAWDGDKTVHGDKHACKDDLVITCKNGKLHNFKYVCES